MLRRHGHVRLELADPPAARLLQLEQALDARVERAVERSADLTVMLVPARSGTLSSQCARHTRARRRYAGSGWWDGVPRGGRPFVHAGTLGTRGAVCRWPAEAAPLRDAATALSIVAGHPVSVQAPARATFGRPVAGPGRAPPSRAGRRRSPPARG